MVQRKAEIAVGRHRTAFHANPGNASPATSALGLCLSARGGVIIDLKGSSEIAQW